MSLCLVTGGAGFIGSSLVRELLRRGERVRVVDNFITGKRENLTEVSHRIELYDLDICDLDQLRPAFQGVDYVFHEAALASVPRSVLDPLSSHRMNVDGTFNVLLAAREARVKRVIYAASSSAYGDISTLPKNESMTPEPISPYGVSKLVGEMYARVFYSVYGLETVSLRYFNVFGPRQDPDSPYSGVLSRFISAMLEGRRPTIFGNGEQSRDFTFVDNVVRANLLACEAPHAAGKVINVATGQRYSLNYIYQALLQIIGQTEETRMGPFYGATRAGDILHSQADISLARDCLGYEPIGTLEECLQQTVLWYLENERKGFLLNTQFSGCTRIPQTALR